MNNIINLDTLAPGLEVPITISTDLYIRIQQCLLEGLPFKDLGHLRSCLLLVQQGKVQDDPLAYHVQTLIHLLNLIESSAKTQGVITTKKFNLETKQLVKS